MCQDTAEQNTRYSPQPSAVRARFEAEGSVDTFDEPAFLRRLATLLGVTSADITAHLTGSTKPNVLNVDAEVAIPPGDKNCCALLSIVLLPQVQEIILILLL